MRTIREIDYTALTSEETGQYRFYSFILYGNEDSFRYFFHDLIKNATVYPTESWNSTPNKYLKLSFSKSGETVRSCEGVFIFNSLDDDAAFMLSNINHDNIFYSSTEHMYCKIKLHNKYNLPYDISNTHVFKLHVEHLNADNSYTSSHTPIILDW